MAFGPNVCAGQSHQVNIVDGSPQQESGRTGYARGGVCLPCTELEMLAACASVVHFYTNIVIFIYHLLLIC